MKKKKRNLNIKKIIIILCIIYCIIFIYIKNKNIISCATEIDYSKNISIFSEYSIIKQDINSNYSGIGQKKVENVDGYFTTFTTVENKQKTYIEYKQNGRSSWSNKEYWNGTMNDNGCGITAISIILSGYNKNYTPENLRKKYLPVLNNKKISTELSKTFGIKNSDFYYDSAHLSNDSIKKHLQSNRPILICVWNKPCVNRWTTASHYMVLLASDNNDMIYISNPNGLENNSKSSGWYNIDEVSPYIAKALYIESYN